MRGVYLVSGSDDDAARPGGSDVPGSSLRLDSWPLARQIMVWAIVATHAIACFAIGVYTRYFVSLNDFWGNLYAAEHVSLTLPESLYNGFYLVGYPLFLRVIGFSGLQQNLWVASGSGS